MDRSNCGGAGPAALRARWSDRIRLATTRCRRADRIYQRRLAGPGGIGCGHRRTVLIAEHQTAVADVRGADGRLPRGSDHHVGRCAGRRYPASAWGWLSLVTGVAVVDTVARWLKGPGRRGPQMAQRRPGRSVRLARQVGRDLAEVTRPSW